MYLRLHKNFPKNILEKKFQKYFSEKFSCTCRYISPNVISKRYVFIKLSAISGGTLPIVDTVVAKVHKNCETQNFEKNYEMFLVKFSTLLLIFFLKFFMYYQPDKDVPCQIL